MAEKEKSLRKEIHGKWRSSDNLPTVYANTILMSHQAQEFYLIFGEIVTPAQLGTIEGEMPDDLDIRPVARIAIPYEVMKSFRKLMNENVDKFIVKEESQKNHDK